MHRTREFVGKNLGGVDALGGERSRLRIEILACGAHTGVSENLRHIVTVSLLSDSEDLRDAV